MSNSIGKLKDTSASRPAQGSAAPANNKTNSLDLQKTQESLNSYMNRINPPPNVRLAYGITNRNKQVMTWRLPNGSSVQMYMNPENFQISESKLIQPTRTKGGFVVQYWGDNLTRLSLSGTTGSSGIKGINILRDVYRSENRAFELVAATQMNELINLVSQETTDAQVSDATRTLANELRNRNFIFRPSLASLAVGVTLFYQGVQYKGFFTEFSVTESIQKLGLFDYNMTFMVTETRGSRENFMAWHKEPVADDIAGQFLNGVGNTIRNWIGLSQQAPEQFHPENAPSTFGESSLAASLGINK